MASGSSIVLLLCVIGSALGQSYVQKGTLFTQLNGGGSYIELNPATSYPGLGNLGWDNLARSANVTGIWLMYQNANFNNQASDAAMEWGFGKNGGYMFNFNSLGLQLSSVRVAGLYFDYSYSTMTLYQYAYFQGAAEQVIIDTSSLVSTASASAIVTGTSPWTVYDQPNFGGNAICLYPEASSDFSPAFVTNLGSLGIPHNSIKSTRKGCFGKKILKLTASTHGRRPGGVKSFRADPDFQAYFQ